MISARFRALLLLLVAIVAACSGNPSTPPPTVISTLPPLPSDTEQPATAEPTQPGGSPSTTDVPASPEASPTAGPPTAPPSLPAGPLADALGPQLDQVLADQQAQNKIPGLTATIRFPDGSTWNGAAGLADPTRNILAAPHTTFVVGSITKTFVTAAIMQLADEGKLSIDDPLSKWKPDYPNAENITLRMLLGHTSGLYDYFNHPEYNLRVFSEPDHHWTPQEVLDSFVLDPKFPPGEGYHYSNTNFLLLGMVVEAATGKPLGEVLRDRFFDPLGLTNTFDQTAGEPPVAGALGCLNRVNGPVCLDDGTNYRPTLSAATVAFGAGSIISTSSDLAEWVRDLYGGSVVSDGALAEMTDWHQYAQEAYGLGTRARKIDGHQAFGHTGSLRGFDAAMWYTPDLDTSLVTLTNRGRIDANPIIDALAAVAIPYAEAYQGQ